MPYLSINEDMECESANSYMDVQTDSTTQPVSSRTTETPPSTLARNRRKRYLDVHPEYFSPDLELAGPLALILSF